MIKILYLYHDLMNLYGDNGTIRFLERCLKDQGQDVEVTRKTVGDDLNDLLDYDMIYIGSSTETNRNVCLEHLYQYRDLLHQAHDSFKLFLCTGNSYELFGKSIDGLYDFHHEGIGLFDFTVTENPEKRYTADVIVQAVPNDMFEEKCVGFINKCSSISNCSTPLFKITGKVGETNSEYDGVIARNFFGTQLIGPVLVKNPAFARYFIKTLLISKGIYTYKDVRYENAEKAYQTTITELSKDIKA